MMRLHLIRWSLLEEMEAYGILFTPQNVEIKVGESVTWRNPMTVSEPHTVTFIIDKDYFPPPATPFRISNLTELKSLLPNPNIEPLVGPD